MDFGINSTKKKYRMLSFLGKKSLISGYFLFIPVYSRLFRFFFLSPKNMGYFQVSLQQIIFKMTLKKIIMASETKPK